MARRCGRGLLFQAPGRGFAHGAHAGEDAAAGRGDLVVARAGQPHLVVHQARRAEDEMRMAVHEARHDDFAGGVDFAGVAGLGEVFDAAGGAGGER